MKLYLSTTSYSSTSNLVEEQISPKFIENINRRFPIYLSKDEFFYFKNSQDRVLFFYFTNPYYSSTGISTIANKFIYPNISQLIQNYKLISISDSLLIKISNQKYIFTILSNLHLYDFNNLNTIISSLQAIIPYLNYFDQLNIDSIVILLPPEFKCHELYIRKIVSEFEKTNPICAIFKKEPLHNLEINKNKLQMFSNYSNKKLINNISKIVNSQLICHNL